MGEGYRRWEVAVPQFYVLQTKRTAINNSLSVRGIYRSIVEVPALLTQIRSRPMIKLNASSNGVGDSQSITAPQGAISTHLSQAAIDRLDPLPSQQEANLVALIENIQHAIWSVDPHYCIITLNSVFRRHFSAIYGVDLQAGTNVVHSLPPEQQSLWASYYDRALQGEQFSVEIGYTLATGSACIHVAFRPIVSTDQAIAGVAVFARDITEHKQAEAALQQAKDQLQAVLDAVPGCVSWFTSDLRYLGINRYLAATFNVRPEDFVGRQLGFMSASPGFAEFVRQFTASSLQESSVEIAADVNGRPRSYLIVAQKYAQDQAAVFVGIDVTDRRQFQEALRESQERYALAVQGANDGLWDWNLKTNDIYFSPRWKAMLGYSEDEIGNQPEEWLGRIHPDEAEWVQAQLIAHWDGLTRQFEIEHRMLHRDGEYRWILSRGLAVRDRNQIAYRMAGSQTDITERKRVEEQLLHDALHDSLTGLSNRALLLDRLGQVIERSKRQGGQFAVLFLDLDRFKVINDSLGHTIGDQLLVAIARRLETCLGAGDTFARVGGDEFVILVESVRDPSDVTRLAERIQQTLRSPFNLQGQDVFTTVSMGIAFNDRACDRPEDMLRNADTAMYRAKTLGRGRHELFDTAMHTRALDLLQLETDLRRAVTAIDGFHREFQLWYQPIVDLESGEVNGFEALVRWRHPERGMVSPAEFIPIAEDTGLIVPLGQWILQEAWHQIQVWRQQFIDHPPLSISVNLSPRQFSQELVAQVRGLLNASKLLDDGVEINLKLEITESALMENLDAATALLRELKTLGVQLLIDDFGTGYSSLSYLHQFPIDTMKIDQSFVSRIGSDNDSEEIVRAIVTLAHNLGMNVIAEGVETLDQVIQLRLLGAEYGQGYFFSKPLHNQGAEGLLAIEPHWIKETIWLS